MTVGTEEQKQWFLPPILAMEQYWCQGFSEPDAGSDLARLRTRAIQEGDSWRISGQKIWTSGAAKAHYCLLLTRTGVVADRHRGMLMFAVPMDTPGIRVVPIRSIDGKESFAEVFFDDVVVPDSRAPGCTGRRLERGHARAGHRAGDQPDVPRLALRGRARLPRARRQVRPAAVEAARWRTRRPHRRGGGADRRAQGSRRAQCRNARGGAGHRRRAAR